MSGLHSFANMLAQTKPQPFGGRWRPLPFIFAEVWDRCPECATKVRSDAAAIDATMDARRDAGLRARDIAEAFETMTLEMLAVEAAWLAFGESGK